MDKENNQEQQKKTLESGGTVWNLFKNFNMDKYVRRRKLRVIKLEKTDENNAEEHVRGFVNDSDRDEGLELTQQDLEYFEQLADKIREVPDIKLRYTSNALTYEEGIYRNPTEVDYYITPDSEEAESSD